MQVISEIGVNWSPKFDKGQLVLDDLKYMIEQSYYAGADYAKIQLFRPEQVFYHELWEDLYKRVLAYKHIEELKIFSDKLGIKLMATPMYLKAAQIMKRFNFEAYKIRELDNQNYWLIDECIKSGKLVLITNSLDAGVPSLFHVTEPDQFSMVTDKYAGISCHVPDVNKILHVASKCKYIELHVKKDDDCIDADISVTFGELKKICGHCSVGSEYL